MTDVLERVDSHRPIDTWAAPLGQAAQRPRTRGWRRLVPWALGVAIVVGIRFGYDSAGGVVALFVIAWPFERIWRRHPVPVRRIGLRTDVTYALVQPVLGAIGIVVAAVIGVLSLAWLPGLAVRPIVTALPLWAQAGFGFLATDVLVYWAHRLGHEMPFLWRFHAVHHSSVHLDWLSGIRSHPFDGVFIAPAFAFLIGAGVPLEIAGALAIAQALTGLFAHMNVRWRLKPLHKIVLTPEFHHWHHANEPAAHHTNYSTFLPVWDLLFGTYRMPDDQRPTRYGIDEPMPTGVLGQVLHPLRRRRREPSV